MIDLLTWSLLVVGLVYAITTSFVFALPRILISRLGLFTKYFIYCPWCVSFWAGMLTEPLYSTQTPWSITWIGDAIVGGFVAMGLVSVLKAAFPSILTPPFELEQGNEPASESIVIPSDEKGPEEFGGPNGQPWHCVKCGNGPLKYAARVVGYRSGKYGGVCDPCLVSESPGWAKECPHRFTNIGPDRRCILCGADET